MQVLNCPGCGRDMSDSTNFVEMAVDGEHALWCLACAEQKFRADELSRARRHAEDCRNREGNPLLVLATWLELDGMHCPNCQAFITGGDKVMLSICEEGVVCGLCGFFIPSLPTLIWNKDGEFWGEEPKGIWGRIYAKLKRIRR